MINATGTFTRKLREQIQPDYEQIINCAFVRRLTDGTLPRSWFIHYVSQDMRYIIADSKALAATAARAENADEMYFLLQMAKDGLDIEREMQNHFIRKYEIPIATEESPAFHEYIKFLLDHAFHSPYPVAVTALLPCFWVYGEAGEYILKNTIRNNPYREWIETYSGELFIGYVQRFIEITETLGQKASPIIIKKMEHTFSQATKHELRIYEEAALH